MSISALVLELNLLIALLGGALALLQGGGVRGVRAFAALCFAGAAWCAGELLLARGIFEVWVGMRLSFLGLVLVAPLWLGLAAEMGRLPLARRLPWFSAALAAPGLLVWSLLLVRPWDALVMPAPHHPGPLWWTYALYAWALILAGCAIHVWSALGQSHRRHRWQGLAIGLTALLPVGVSVAWTWLDFPGAYDPTPMALTPVGIALASALFPGGLLDVRPLAQRGLIAHLPLGVVMADRSGTVFEVNPHAEAALARAREAVVGRSLEAVVSEAPPSYRVEISEVTLASRVVARFAFLYPPEMQGADHSDAA
jgi:PAS domain-containing protein